MPDLHVLDLSRPEVKMRLVQRIMALEGPHEVIDRGGVLTIKQRHRGRTLRQNAFYWVAVVPAFVDALREQWGEEVSEDDAHAMLKERFLKVRKRRVDEETGEIPGVLEYVRSTTTLTTVEFSDYIDQCRKFLMEWFRVEVEDPSPLWRELREAA